MSDDLRNKLGSAYRQLMFEYPFFYTMLLMMQRIEVKDHPEIQTMATDGKNLYYNPEFVEKLTAAEVAGVLAHEALHVALLHLDRILYRNLSDWNWATDEVVNYHIRDARLTLPPDCVPGVENATAEERYTLRQQQKGGGKGGKTQWNVGGIVLPKDAQGKPLNEQQSKEWIDDIKLRVSRAMDAAKQAGKMPANLERDIRAMLRHKVPWQAVLQRFMSERTSVWQDWNRPQRRWLSQGLILPSDGAVQVANIIIACDTSGSVGQDDLSKMCGEILSFKQSMEDAGGESEPVMVLWCDTEVHEQLVETAEELSPRGGGGTTADPVFAYIKEKDYTPDAVVYMTDGYIGGYGDAPPYPVLWILTKDGDPNFEPPFGEVAYCLD